MSEFLDAMVFGRNRELSVIENSILDSSSNGVSIEGETGMGKTRLLTEIHRRRGGRDLRLKGDRVLHSVPFGALGMIVDLDEDRGNLLHRVVEALTVGRQTPVVFVDDAHELDERSLSVLSQLADDGRIKIVAAMRPNTGEVGHPFVELVADHVLDQMVLEPLEPDGYAEMIEHYLGGIVSRGVLDIVGFHTGRVPGKVIELLRYTGRAKRFLDRQGVWVLDGLDIDYDERARDVTRIDLNRYSTAERHALELVILAGEVDIELMLEADLGDAADSLVASGELRLEQRPARVYVANENHASETIRFTVPDGRSRQMFELVSGFPDTPSTRAIMLRTDWGIRCGADIPVHAIIDGARLATHLGEWQRALRMLNEVPTDHMAAHELFDLGRLYCEVNQVPIGFDVLAQAVEKACCAQVIFDAFQLWVYRDFDRNSPALCLDDFHQGLDRLDSRPERSTCEGLDADIVRELMTMLAARPLAETAIYEPEGIGPVPEDRMRTTLKSLHAISRASRSSEMGDNREALEALNAIASDTTELGTGSVMLTTLRANSLVKSGDVSGAKQLMSVQPSADLAFIASRSGPTDLMWSYIHLLEGQLSEATRCSHSAVEALDHWNQVPFLAIAIAHAAYVSMLSGNVAAAGSYDSRFEALPSDGPYLEYRRALMLRAIVRALREGIVTGEIHEMLARMRVDGSFGLEAQTRLLLFYHFAEADPEAMCFVAEQGNGGEFDLLRVLGKALRDSDGAALLEIAAQCETSAPLLVAQCRAMADRFLESGALRSDRRIDGRSGLTVREREISGLVTVGRTNAEIARELGVGVRTVEGHIYRLFQKLGIARREQVAAALETLDAEGHPPGGADRTAPG